MTTAIIGTGGIGFAIARELAAGGESLRLASADHESARTLAAKIGHGAVAAADNHDALEGADAVILALRFTVLKGVIAEIADRLAGKLVVVPSNPITADAHGNLSRLLPPGQAAGNVVARLAAAAPAWRWRSEPCRPTCSVLEPPVTQARGPVLRNRRRQAGREVERLIRTAGFERAKVGGLDQSTRLEVGGDLHELVVGPAQARSLVSAAAQTAAQASLAGSPVQPQTPRPHVLDPEHPVHRPRVRVEDRAGRVLVGRLHRQQRDVLLVIAGDRPAQEDDPPLDQLIGEVPVLVPETLLARTARPIPVRPLSRPDREHRHRPSAPSGLHIHCALAAPLSARSTDSWPSGRQLASDRITEPARRAR